LAARKTNSTKKVLVDDGYFSGVEWGYVKGLARRCTTMQNKSNIEDFWVQTNQDEFGKDVIHERTLKLFLNYLFTARMFSDYKLKNTRKPTDIIVTTEGYCFSACSFFVNNIIRFGAAIVAGYGLTNPGDDLFVAAQCPSTVINPADYFKELRKNSEYGLRFDTSITETYNVSTEMDESIPGDYDILRIDKYMKYYNVTNIMTDEFFELTKEVHQEFQTNCNPMNKRLFMITKECKSSDPNASYSGYICGANGKWDKSVCKIAACEPPYVVDYDNNQCVLNPCDVNYASTDLYTEEEWFIIYTIVFVSFLVVGIVALLYLLYLKRKGINIRKYLMEKGKHFIALTPDKEGNAVELDVPDDDGDHDDKEGTVYTASTEGDDVTTEKESSTKGDDVAIGVKEIIKLIQDL